LDHTNISVLFSAATNTEADTEPDTEPDTELDTEPDTKPATEADNIRSLITQVTGLASGSTWQACR
jgi:hypothetical protein